MLDNASSVTNRWWPNQTGAFTWIRTISPTLTNELILTGTRDYQRRGTGDYKTDYTRERARPAESVRRAELPDHHQHRSRPTIRSAATASSG